jgi:hypothetical protein
MKMLELKTYKKPDLSAMFSTQGMQALRRKLERYGITFEVSGTGERAVFEIKEIADRFKLFCITELGFDGRTDFIKVRNFYHHFFNDEEFMAMPDEVKEYRLRQINQDISRQTIAGYMSKLERNDLINRTSKNFKYYFAYRQTQRFVEREEYLRAWHEYWKDINDGYNSYDAINRMIVNYGGVARKQAIPEINGIYLDKINLLCDLIQESYENEFAEKLKSLI